MGFWGFGVLGFSKNSTVSHCFEEVLPKSDSQVSNQKLSTDCFNCILYPWTAEKKRDALKSACKDKNNTYHKESNVALTKKVSLCKLQSSL